MVAETGTTMPLFVRVVAGGLVLGKLIQKENKPLFLEFISYIVNAQQLNNKLLITFVATFNNCSHI